MLPKDAEAIFALIIEQVGTKGRELHAALAFAAASFATQSENWAKVGKAQFDASDFDSSAVSYGRAANYSHNAMHRFCEATALMKASRHQDAIQAFETGLDMRPRNIDAMLSLAQCYRSLGKISKARDVLRKTVEMDAKSYKAFFLLGVLSEALRDQRESIKYYSACIKLKPDFAEAHVNLGLVLQNNRQFKPALECYKKAMRIRPDYFGRIAQAVTSAQCGQMWLNLGRLRQSLQS